MKYVDEFRNPEAVRALLKQIQNSVQNPWSIMEICGGQTHALLRHGLDMLLPASINLVHGPGCPVCVTAAETIDKAIAISKQPKTILCSFGDMLRVPGQKQDLLSAKAEGADIRVIYSPLDAVAVAEKNPQHEIVLFGIGFETTAPTTASAVLQAHEKRIPNFSLLNAHVLVPPAMRAILSAPEQRIDGFLAAGHVCTVMGTREYEDIAQEFSIPIVITGFEPFDLAIGLLSCIECLEKGMIGIVNQYARSVKPEGNVQAQKVMCEVYQPTHRKWRGIGLIPDSGLGFKPAYADFDAENRFPLHIETESPSTGCMSGEILQGLKKPPECQAFGKSCTPEHPLGATMVSSEGACAAYFRYRRH